jgi:hypothetical protein
MYDPTTCLSSGVSPSYGSLVFLMVSQDYKGKAVAPAIALIANRELCHCSVAANSVIDR